MLPKIQTTDSHGRVIHDDGLSDGEIDWFTAINKILETEGHEKNDINNMLETIWRLQNPIEINFKSYHWLISAIIDSGLSSVNSDLLNKYGISSIGKFKRHMYETFMQIAGLFDEKNDQKDSSLFHIWDTKHMSQVSKHAALIKASDIAENMRDGLPGISKIARAYLASHIVHRLGATSLSTQIYHMLGNFENPLFAYHERFRKVYDTDVFSKQPNGEKPLSILEVFHTFLKATSAQMNIFTHK